MRYTSWILAAGVAFSFLHPGAAWADHDLTCHPPSGKGGNVEFEWKVEEGETSLQLLTLTAGGVSQSECSAGETPGLVPVFLTPEIPHVVQLDSGDFSLFWFFGPIDPSFPETRVGQSADLPGFTKPDGTPLLAQYQESDLDFLLQFARGFTIGDELSITDGLSSSWPGVLLLEMPQTFELEELFTRPAGEFTPYTGTARVADVAQVQVIPEPMSALLLMLALVTYGGLTRRGKQNNK